MGVQESIGFWNPVINPYEGFDSCIAWKNCAEQCFDFGQKRFQVVDCVDGSDRCVEIKSSNIPTIILKIVLLATVLIPLIMLAIKCSHRLSRNYVVRPEDRLALVHQPQHGLATLPQPILLKITSYLSSSKELVSIATTNRTSSVVLRANLFWTPLAKQLEPKAALLQIVVPLEERNAHAKEYIQYILLMERCKDLTSDVFTSRLQSITQDTHHSKLSGQIKAISLLAENLDYHQIEPREVASLRRESWANSQAYATSRKLRRPLSKVFYRYSSAAREKLHHFEQVIIPGLRAALDKIRTFATLLEQSQRATQLVQSS